MYEFFELYLSTTTRRLNPLWKIGVTLTLNLMAFIIHKNFTTSHEERLREQDLARQQAAAAKVSPPRDTRGYLSSDDEEDPTASTASAVPARARVPSVQRSPPTTVAKGPPVSPHGTTIDSIDAALATQKPAVAPVAMPVPGTPKITHRDNPLLAGLKPMNTQ